MNVQKRHSSSDHKKQKREDRTSSCYRRNIMSIISSSILRLESPTATGDMQINKKADTKRNQHTNEQRQNQQQKREELTTHVLQKKHYGHHT